MNHVTTVTIAAGAVAKDVSCLRRAEALDGAAQLQLTRRPGKGE